MNISFDKFDRMEVPHFYVCNPGSEYRNGVLTKTLGILPHTKDEEIIANFNATSELNFRAHRLRSRDKAEDAYCLMLYNALQNRRLIFVDGIGFFVITDVSDDYDAGIYYKDIRAESCEHEIANKIVPYIEDGTYLFVDLLEKLVEVLPLWKIGFVNGDVARKYRTFEGVSDDQNILSFMLENMQDAYECIFVMDITNRLINVYDQNNYVERTQIHITKDDVINSIQITENSDDLYTAISVLGDDNLNISPVNPIGTNVIYDFSYYLSWMSDNLREKVSNWQDLVASKEKEYYDLNLRYYEMLTGTSTMESEIDRIDTQLTMYRRCRENIVAEGTTSAVESYNEVIESNGGTPVNIQGELNETITEIDSLIDKAEAQKASVQNSLNNLASDKSTLYASILKIHEAVSIDNYFTVEEYGELANYIYEGSFRDEYITVTDSMTYSEKFQQMKTLYDRAKQRLEKISQPTQQFSIDVENFLFEKEFSAWSNELKTGCLINVELSEDDVAELFLTDITVNYEDLSLRMTFGNRFNRFDPKAIFNNALGNIKKSANSLNYIKEILYPVKSGQISAMQEILDTSRMLTKNMVLSSENEEVVIDDTGYTGRKLLDNGEYDPQQVKLTSKTLVFTKDAWETAETALGNFLYYNPETREVEERYGLIANTILGNIVLSERVGIFNENANITLDHNGFKLVSDGTVNPEYTTVFEIGRLVTTDSGETDYVKQLYLDSEGNLVLNGSIGIFTGSETNTSIIDMNLELQTQMNHKTSVLEETIQNSSNELYDAIKSESDEINATIDSKINVVSGSVTEQIKAVSSEIDSKYASIIDDVNNQLAAHKADVGQYMTFSNDGLTLGATSSEFKTVIDNTGLYFKQGNTIVSYVDNNQLHIPNAVIESTLILGNFFFSPREDGSVSLTWQE